MADFETLVLDQERTGQLIANIASLTRNPAATQYSYADVEARLELLEAYWNTFASQDFTLQREARSRADSPYFKLNKYNEGLALYLQAKAWFKDRLRVATTSRNTTTVSQSNATGTSMQTTQSALEKVRLPRFNGRRRDWEAFKEKFSSLIVDDVSIAPIIKLQHLTNCLEGEAKERLRGIQQSVANFMTAWETLCRRYDNKYLRFKAQMQLLANIPPAEQETESNLSQVLNIVNESINVFRTLERPVDQWDDLLIYFVESKLPPETRKDWAKEVERKKLPEFPKFAQLKEFLEGRLDTLDVVEMEKEYESQTEAASNASADRSNKGGKRHHFSKRGKSSSVNVATNSKGQGKPAAKCSFCQGDHFLSYCQNFVRCSQEEKRAHVAAAGLCFNCLKAGHRQSACTSKNKCFVCGESHHTKLHDASNAAETSASTIQTAQGSTTACAAINHSPRQASVRSGGVLLATACVILQAPSGQSMTVRALLDSGAEESFISEHVTQALRLRQQPVNVMVSGVGGNPTATSKYKVTAVLKSDCNPDFSLRFSALVLRKLTATLPSETVTLPPWPELKGLKLADPGLCTPRRIDCILNSEAYAAALQPGIKQAPCGSLVAVQSVFGWVLMGAAGSSGAHEGSSAVHHITVDQKLTEAVIRFWELEEVPKRQLLTPEEQDCYAQFKDTHRRDPDGRFVVRLPFVKPPAFSDTRHIAENCLLRLERRLQRDSKLADAYTAFMDEYRSLRHLEDVPDNEIDRRSAYYLPHHPVVKADGSGKIRVVFNASQRDSEGNSLNTFLPTGPKLQEDGLIIIVSWAFLQVVFTCDIVKMFRGFRMDPWDVDWQRILLRDKTTGSIRVCRLSTVTYGTGCASFLANACLLQLAEDERERYPEASEAIEKDRYVDDFFTGADDMEGALRLRDQLIAILDSACLQLGKWASNRQELLPGSEDIISVGIPNEETDTVSTLGLSWNASEDVFCFKIKEVPSNEVVTKRVILSAIARLFDPVGWLSPFIVRPKILLQDLWMRGLDWDTPCPPDLTQTWIQFRDQLPQLERIKIPRWYGTTTTTSWQLHAFCDASERAFAAALYIVVQTERGVVSRLMAAKSKVSPLKIISLPRLELCGTGLLATLASYLLPKLPRIPDQIHCWTDSKVALAWISSHPSRWQTFVANRVTDIHEKLPTASWRHVRSAENPADLATRGVTPAQLEEAEIWWRGPDWICKPPCDWPSTTDSLTPTELELRRVKAHCAITTSDAEDFSRWFLRFSSFEKLVRVIARILRWRLNVKLPRAGRIKGWLTARELESSRIAVFKVVQAEVYGAEIEACVKRGLAQRTSSIRRLSPFLDQLGVLRVGGRLHNAFLSESEKHPVILPANHHITRLIVSEAHIASLHGGPTLVQSVLARRYWIVRGRNFIRSTVRQCVRCARMRAATIEPPTGPLPAVRTQPTRPFSCVGVDFAGPFFLKASPGRGQKCYKGYVSVFVCMVIRAVHLEVVSDYTSSAFLAAFRRFAGRRGTPSKVYSDNGTNFKGADAELRRLFSEVSAVSQEVAAELARDGIEWSYSPPRAPHFGGLWEASVKSFKHHFKRVVGDAKLTFEEFSTLNASIEACLNSRPISVQNPCEEDPAVLTPGHFLIGAALTAPPEPFEETNETTTASCRWKRVVLMRNFFWKRWQREWLAQVQAKSKWLQPSRDFKVGDVVLFKEALMPPTKWPLARITRLYVGDDKASRVAVIRTASAEYKRPTTKLVLLPVSDSSDQD